MRYGPVGLVFATLLLAALSGCAAGKAKEVPPPVTDDPYALPEGVTNILQGTVVGPDQAPLESALVEVISLDLNQTTNEGGEYRFENLEPRDYLVVVTKDGYKTKTQRAIIEDGKIFELNFQLDERPALAPYSSLMLFRGFISCQIAYATNPENVQYQDCGSADPNNKAAREFDLEPGGAQAQIEAFWVAKQEGAKYLTMQVESVGFGHQDIIFGSQSGQSGLKMVISQSLMEKYYPQGGTLRVAMSAAPGVLGDQQPVDFGLAFQQDFEVYLTVFYVEPGPVDYTAKPK